jgi:hypothetical protein
MNWKTSSGCVSNFQKYMRNSMGDYRAKGKIHSKRTGKTKVDRSKGLQPVIDKIAKERKTTTEEVIEQGGKVPKK